MLRSGLLVCLAEILLGSLGCGLDRLRSWFPIGGTHLTMFLMILERLHEAECLIDGASDGGVVDSDLTECTGGVDDEQTTEGETLVFDQDT